VEAYLPELSEKDRRAAQYPSAEGAKEMSSLTHRIPACTVVVLSLVLAAVFCMTAMAAEPSNAPVLLIESGMHTAVIDQIAVDAMNHYLVTGSRDKTIRVWDLTTTKLIRVLRPPVGPGIEGMIHAVAISPDGRTIAAGGVTGDVKKSSFSVYLFDRSTGQLVKQLPGLPQAVHCLAFSPDGRWLATSLAGVHGIRLYETSEYSLVAEDSAYGGSSQGAAFDANSRLVTTSLDGYLRLYELTGSKEHTLRLIKKASAPGGMHPANVGFAPDGTKIAVGFYDSSKVDVLSAQDLSWLYSPTTDDVNDGDNMKHVTWSADGKRLYAAGSHRKQYQDKSYSMIRVWSDQGLGPARDYQATRNTIMALHSLKVGGVVFGTADPAIGVLDTQGQRILFQPSIVADFRSIGFGIPLSANGSTVAFRPLLGKSPARFSVATRMLDQFPKSNTDLTPARTETDGSLHITDWQQSKAPKLNGQSLRLIPGEASSSLAIAPDERHFVLGGQWALHCYNHAGLEVWMVQTNEEALSVNISGDGQLVVGAFGNGTIRWFRMRDGRELLSLFLDMATQRWILWTSNGYFDASDGAENLIGWHVNQGEEKEGLFFPVAQFFEQLYRPDLIQEVLQSKSTDMELLARLKDSEPLVVSRGFKLPPKATILTPAEGSTIDRADVDLQIQVEDQGGGVNELRLYQNSKLVASEGFKGASSSEKIQRRTLHVTALPGKNLFRVVALSKNRIEGTADERIIEWRVPGAKPDGSPGPVLPDKPTLHVLVVGLNQYKNPALNLNYALPDARGLQTFFDVATSQLFKTVKRYELYDAAATKVAILAQFQELQTSAPEDVVLIYLAGHGESVGDTWYFVPYEVTTPERDEVLEAKAFSSRELKEQVTKMKAQKVLVLLDSCKSGAALVAFAGRGIGDRRALAQLARATGTFLVAASTSEQVAGEVKELGHGIFTYALLQGLKGAADGGKQKDGVITVRELLAYVENQLPELSAKYKSQPQYPVVDSRGMDFPLAVVP
jgi:WD40 repeat protein